MLKNNQIISRRKKTNKSSIQVDQYTGADWGEKLSFTVGFSYVIGGGIGLLKGLYYGIPRNLSLPPRLLLNNMVNSIGKESSRLGNAAGAASQKIINIQFLLKKGFVYYLIGIGLNTFFEEELSNFTQIQKNMICGALTGGVFKSTLGILPFCVGSILGGAGLGCFTHTVNYLNKKGKVSFEVKF